MHHKQYCPPTKAFRKSSWKNKLWLYFRHVSFSVLYHLKVLLISLGHLEQNPEPNKAMVVLINIRFIKEGDEALEKWAA